MKKLFAAIPFAALFCFPSLVEAQTDSLNGFQKTVFIEAFGQGLQASLNYDMRFKKGSQYGLGFRAGIGGIFAGSSDAGAGPESSGVIAFPFGINYLAGKNRSAIEAGIGLVPQKVNVDPYSPTKPKVAGENGWGTNRFLNLGYRYQANNGFVFRFLWTPVFGDIGFISRFGISAGWGFR